MKLDYSTLYKVKKGDELLDGKVPNIKWYLPNFILKGFHTIIYGEGGCGKSTLLINVGLCISSGKDSFMGKSIQGNVLFIDEEMGDVGFKIKSNTIAKELGIEKEDIKDTWNYMCTNGWMWDVELSVGWLEWFCKENKIDVVIIDSLVGSASTDITTQLSISKLKKLLKWGYNNNVTFIINHHTNKEGSGEGKVANAKSMYGSIIIDQTVDHSYGINRYDNKLVIQQNKARWVPPENKLNINVPIKSMTYGKPYGSSGYEYKDVILETLENLKKGRYKDLQEIIVPKKGTNANVKKKTMSEATLSKYLKILCTENKVKKEGDWYTPS